jgi:hypothetical protein
MLFAGKWMELETMMLSEISQAQKGLISHFHLYTESRPIIIMMMPMMIMGHKHERGTVRRGQLGR